MWAVKGLDFVIRMCDDPVCPSGNFVAVSEGVAFAAPEDLQRQSVGATGAYNDRFPCFHMDAFCRIELLDCLVGRTTVEHNHTTLTDKAWKTNFYNHITWDLYSHWRARLPKTKKSKTPTKQVLAQRYGYFPFSKAPPRSNILSGTVTGCAGSLEKEKSPYKDYFSRIRNIHREQNSHETTVREELTCTYEKPKKNSTRVENPMRIIRGMKHHKMEVDESTGDDDDEIDEFSDDDDDDEEMMESELSEEGEDLITQDNILMSEEAGTVQICGLQRTCLQHGTLNCARCKHKGIHFWNYKESCKKDGDFCFLGLTQGYVWRWWDSFPTIPSVCWHDAEKINCEW